jgi:hypothetical protein
VHSFTAESPTRVGLNGRHSIMTAARAGGSLRHVAFGTAVLLALVMVVGMRGGLPQIGRRTSLPVVCINSTHINVKASTRTEQTAEPSPSALPPRKSDAVTCRVQRRRARHSLASWATTALTFSAREHKCAHTWRCLVQRLTRPQLRTSLVAARSAWRPTGAPTGRFEATIVASSLRRTANAGHRRGAAVCTIQRTPRSPVGCTLTRTDQR